MTKPKNTKPTKTELPIPKSWRDVLKIHPAAEMFPLLSPDELKALGEDIKKNGLRNRIHLHGGYDGPLLDGRNRLDAMELAGVRLFSKDGTYFDIDDMYETVPTKVDPYEFVLSQNVHRRHLTPGQKRDLIAAVLKAQPDKSNRQVAKQTKVSHHTVEKIRKGLEATGQIAQLSKTTGADGKARTTKPKKQRRTSDDFVADMKAKQQAKAARRANRESELAAKITALPSKKYGVIYADPPWQFEPWSRDSGMDRAADNHYPTLAYPQICALDVASIAADNCILFLWVTVPMAHFGHRLLDGWGFEYRSQFVWNKNKIGTGYWNRNKHEILLVGARGNVPAPAPGTQELSVIDAPVGKHSAKPEKFVALIERYFPTLPKIELYRRGAARAGWDAWGNEATESDAIKQTTKTTATADMAIPF